MAGRGLAGGQGARPLPVGSGLTETSRQAPPASSFPCDRRAARSLGKCEREQVAARGIQPSHSQPLPGGARRLC